LYEGTPARCERRGRGKRPSRLDIKSYKKEDDEEMLFLISPFEKGKKLTKRITQTNIKPNNGGVSLCLKKEV